MDKGEKQKKKLPEKAAASASAQKMTISSYYVSTKVTVSMTKDTYIDAIVKMVVREGVALRFFSSESYKLGHGELAQKVGVSLNRDAVTGYVISAAETMKDRLREEVKGKFLFIKLDCATRLRTNYLGVTVRFINRSTVPSTKTLALVDTRAQHTSKDLKAMLLKILDEFKIEINQVICIVTDNASNNIRMVKDLNIDISASSSSHTSSAMSLSDDDETESDTDTSPAAQDSDRFEDNVRASLPATSHIRCGMHTFQLAILEGLKNTHAASLLFRCRAVAKECLTPKIHKHIKKELKISAVLDQDTRWGSTFVMLEKLIKLKPVILEIEALGRNEKLHMTTSQWNQAQELKDMLQKSYTITKKMQLENLTVGYFMRQWTGLKWMLEENGGLIALEILSSMNRRERELFDQPIVQAAVHLDAANASRLKAEQVQTAENAVIELVLRMKGLETENREREDHIGTISHFFLWIHIGTNYFISYSCNNKIKVYRYMQCSGSRSESRSGQDPDNLPDPDPNLVQNCLDPDPGKKIANFHLNKKIIQLSHLYSKKQTSMLNDYTASKNLF